MFEVSAETAEVYGCSVKEEAFDDLCLHIYNIDLGLIDKTSLVTLNNLIYQEDYFTNLKQVDCRDFLIHLCNDFHFIVLERKSNVSFDVLEKNFQKPGLACLALFDKDNEDASILFKVSGATKIDFSIDPNMKEYDEYYFVYFNNYVIDSMMVIGKFEDGTYKQSYEKFFGIQDGVANPDTLPKHSRDVTGKSMIEKIRTEANPLLDTKNDPTYIQQIKFIEMELGPMAVWDSRTRIPSYVTKKEQIKLYKKFAQKYCLIRLPEIKVNCDLSDMPDLIIDQPCYRVNESGKVIETFKDLAIYEKPYVSLFLFKIITLSGKSVAAAPLPKAISYEFKKCMQRMRCYDELCFFNVKDDKTYYTTIKQSHRGGYGYLVNISVDAL